MRRIDQAIGKRIQSGAIQLRSLGSIQSELDVRWELYSRLLDQFHSDQETELREQLWRPLRHPHHKGMVRDLILEAVKGENT